MRAVSYAVGMPRTAAVMLVVLTTLSTAAATVAAESGAPAAPDDSFSEVERLLEQKDYEAALGASTRATQEHPRSGRASLQLGRTLFYLERDAEALVALNKSIELAPASSEAWFFRGLLFVYGEKPDLARADFEKAAQLNPKDPRYWLQLGRIDARAGRVEAATLALEKVVVLDPRSAVAWFTLGVLASTAGDHAKAAKLWDKALQCDPDHLDAHYNLGLHHQLRGDPKVSLSHYLAVLEKRPGDVEAAKKVVQVCYQLEDYEKAAFYRAKLLELIARSADPKIREMKEFCFDQFDAPGGRFFAYETLEKKGDLYYWFTFKLFGGDELLRSINLESSAVLREGGLKFILGKDEGSVHTSFGVAFKDMPPYPELKQLVLKANAGQLTPAATSQPSRP